jgi:hypothetical protein
MEEEDRRGGVVASMIREGGIGGYMTVFRYICTSLACLYLLSACSPEKKHSSVTVTVNIAEADSNEIAQCSVAFRAGERSENKEADGSAWIWVRGDDGTLSHYCRRQAGGQISAWDEASASSVASHSLRFNSNDSPVIFQPIEAK